MADEEVGMSEVSMRDEEVGMSEIGMDHGSAGHTAAADGDPRQLRAAALDLLARREHSRRELLRKLGQRFPAAEPAQLEAVLEALAAAELQSDSRFCTALINMRARKGSGPLRIRLELREKGIDAGLISAGLSSDAVDWFAVAAEVWRKKFGPADTAAPADRQAQRREQARQYRFLQYRGFTPEQIAAALAGGGDGDNADVDG